MQQSQQQHFLMTARDHNEMARYIAARDVHVPLAVLRLLVRCIKLRRECMAVHSPDSRLGDEGHRHFVCVLETVHGILADHYKMAIRLGLAVGSENDQGVRLEERETRADAAGLFDANRFLELDTEDWSITDEIGEGSDRMVGDGDVIGRNTFRSTMTVTDVAVQAVSFLVEAYKFRSHIREIWTDYKAGVSDPITVSLVPNAGIELLADTYAELDKSIHIVDAPFRGNTLGLAVILLQGIAGPACCTTRKFYNLDANDPVRPYCQLLLVHRLEQLQLIAWASEEGRCPFYLLDYALDSTKQQFSPSQLRSDFKRTTDILFEYRTMLEQGKALEKEGRGEIMHSLQQLDATSRILKDFFATKKANWLAALVCQLMLDIISVLGDTGILHDQIENDVKRMKRNLVDITIPCAVPIDELKTINDLVDIAIYVLDCTAETTSWVHGTCNKSEANISSRQRLVCSQILYGRMLATATLQYRIVGLTLLFRFPVITSIAYLCKAVARHESDTAWSGADDLDWRDLDVLAAISGAENVYGILHDPINRPASLREIIVSLMHCLGRTQAQIADSIGVSRLDGCTRARIYGKMVPTKWTNDATNIVNILNCEMNACCVAADKGKPFNASEAGTIWRQYLTVLHSNWSGDIIRGWGVFSKRKYRKGTDELYSTN